MIRLFSALLVLFFAACSESAPEANVVSGDSELQAAYEVCLAEMSAEMLADNPDLPEEFKSAMLDGARQACESAVVRTCERGKQNQDCQLILEMYAS